MCSCTHATVCTVCKCLCIWEYYACMRESTRIHHRQLLLESEPGKSRSQPQIQVLLELIYCLYTAPSSCVLFLGPMVGGVCFLRSLYIRTMTPHESPLHDIITPQGPHFPTHHVGMRYQHKMYRDTNLQTTVTRTIYLHLQLLGGQAMAFVACHGWQDEQVSARKVRGGGSKVESYNKSLALK